jgi:hypothetical protein
LQVLRRRGALYSLAWLVALGVRVRRLVRRRLAGLRPVSRPCQALRSDDGHPGLCYLKKVKSL